MTINIKVSDHLSLSLPVLKVVGDHDKSFLVALDVHTAKLIQPKQEVFLISDHGKPAHRKGLQAIHDIHVERDGLVLTLEPQKEPA